MREKESIEKKLTQSIMKVSMIMAAAALLGVIALIIISNRYADALENYGFAQGDIGRAMYEFSEARSSLRAAIGFDDEAVIQKTVVTYEECKAAFNEAFAEVENSIVSKEGRETYDAIKAELPAFWEMADEVVEIGAVTDRERCIQAQEIAISSLMAKFTSIYEKLESLLDVKVEQGNSLSAALTVVSWILSIAIIVIIAGAMVTSTKIGKNMARKIAIPLQDLGARLKTFAAGDLHSPFPMVDTGDEIEIMEEDAREMATTLETIIFDIGEVLGEMASGNYTVKSKAEDRYTGDFQKLYESMRELRNRMSATLVSIGAASKQVSGGSDELATSAQSLAEGATEQAGAVFELNTTISNITEAMERSAQSADESYNMSHEYADRADQSRQEMNTMMEAMKRISETSTQIGNIISEIESIAAQTNLLSLNASIEAARAGDAGRGFAVVADEIRGLADQSAKAAVDTRELIEASIREVSTGNSVADHAAASIEAVVDGIKQIADFSQNLKVIMEEQAEAMRQAEKEVNQISGVVESNAAVAQEASATSQELYAQATLLDELVGQFELPEE
ncbi:MAG: MCP four helix bundle domain-containing protein [Acetatifactor sp.]|nr:MCP four helix bundle domain-containing protein [Acetatifactor sp.]